MLFENIGVFVCILLFLLFLPQCSKNMLSIVATPIGNLEDITLRALRTLREADAILCEDTRTTSILLNHYEIRKPLISYHAHSDEHKITQIITRLTSGESIALVSDAGTPGISDPLYTLLQACLEHDISVTPIPGPSAVVTAVSASGLHMHDFRFLGFLPVKKGRQTLFLQLKEKDYTVVIYESVHRIDRTLSDIESYFGSETPIVVARELTKKFETFHRGSVAEIRTEFAHKPPK